MGARFVVVWSASGPAQHTFDLSATKELVLRSDHFLNDDRIGAKQLKLRLRGDRVDVTNLDRQRDVWVDGVRVDLMVTMGSHRSVIRLGRTVGTLVFDSGDAETVPCGELAEVVARAAGGQPIDASVVERCLQSAWRDREEIAAVIASAMTRCRAAGDALVREQHLPELRPLRPTTPFARVFEDIMGAPPPFEIPTPYKALAFHRRGGVHREVLIGRDADPPILVQAQLGAVSAQPPGWFQAGFSGHGVNSYSLFYGRVTERYQLFLGLPYGDGVYCRDPAAERARALAKLAKYLRLVETLPVRHVMLSDSEGTADYAITRHDGTVVRPTGDLFSLDMVDLEALAR